MFKSKKLHLGLLVTAHGSHPGSWRMPEATPEKSFEFETYISIAKSAERGLFDFLFFADTLALVPHRNPATYGRSPLIAHLEPFTLLSALAAVTQNIGLAGSATTTYNTPYQVARILASLDHISHGRAAWNLITSGNPGEAGNFGFAEHPDHDDRYERAGEFADVVFGLWDSWGNDAFCFDKTSGRYFDPEKLQALNHSGKHFKVKGPLNIARSPQGRPVVAQAGSSNDGRNLAARTAEVVFTAQQDFAGAKAFYDDVRKRADGFGRNQGDIVILPGIVPIVGRTDEEALEKKAALDEAFDPLIGIDLLSFQFGIDLSTYPLDKPLPPDLPASPKANSRRELMLAEAARDQLTLRQLAARMAMLGHWTLSGSPGRVADQLQELHEGGAADGFIIIPASLPDGIDDFVQSVVPELQKRGLFRTHYESSTLRGNLGLAFPTPNGRLVKN